MYVQFQNKYILYFLIIARCLCCYGPLPR